LACSKRARCILSSLAMPRQVIMTDHPCGENWFQA
jgi:hypothetical protein